jgi:ribosome biogenesis ATPase
VNLNTPVPSAPATPAIEEIPGIPQEAPTNTGGIVTQAEDVAAAVAAPLPVTASPAPASKRKTRSTRTADGAEERSSKRIKTTSGAVSKDHTPPTTRLSDLGGVQSCVEKMLELVAMPLCHPEVYLHTGIQPPRGVLLHGPPGCGKTLLANAIAGVCTFTQIP